MRAAKAAKQRLREIEAEEDLSEELSEQMLRAGLRHRGADQPGRGRGRAAGGARQRGAG